MRGRTMFKNKSESTESMSNEYDTLSQHRWASNITGWDEGNVRLMVRSLDPKFTNMVSVRPKGPLMQVDFSFVELDVQPSNKMEPGKDFEQKINLQDNSILPHTTMLLPHDVAQTLMQQLQTLYSQPAETKAAE
jgi:hypothetical protein